jgi:hypothetical protein
VKTRKARLKLENTKDEFTLIVVEDYAAEHKEADKYYEKYRSDEYEEDDNDGLFIPATKPITGKKREIGAIILVADKVTHGLLAHEAWHAALHHDQEVVGYTGNYSGDYISNYSPEERMAYKIQELVSKMAVALRTMRVRLEYEPSIYS